MRGCVWLGVWVRVGVGGCVDQYVGEGVWVGVWVRVGVGRCLGEGVCGRYVGDGVYG